ncbi:transglycosylase family protein [Streptomyces sp. NPDC048604]|uniref:transglycosylase family protein n=1 Tax=Streptomyces sp. NPDC048604 TaxID=3365578 RepID=UPI0037121D17
MRSGNGRHRRPRQAPALVVAAGVTGSALALPLLAAGSASAADGATWDRVAECESGGLWSADFGNGLYGGLQFTQETWDSYGGTEYAARPDLASRAQQIAVAEKALAAQGAKTWATCAAIVGLKDDGTLKPSTKPGGVLPTAPTTPSTSADADANQDDRGEDSPGKVKSDKSLLPDASGQPGDESAESGAPATPTTPAEDHATPSDPSAPGTGKHRGDAATENPDESGDSSESGRHAAPADDATRDAGRTDLDEAGVNGTDETKDAKGKKADTSDEYTVQPGDNLTQIAAEHELDGGWRALYKANKETVGGDPDLILPGQNLELTDRQK